MSSGPSWEGIKETALENDKLAADIRVSDDAVQVNAPGMLQRFKVAIGFEKAPVYASRDETLTNLREQFGLDFSQKLRTLIQETGIRTDSEEYKTLVTHAMQSFDVITQKLTTTIATPAISTSQAIQEAHLGSLNSLHLLRECFARPQQTPQFCVTKEGKISVLQPAPHPENFVLSGGGVKGAGYVGWFKAAEKFGVLKNLKRIAGSSAGAMTAALIASGMNAEDLKKANDRTSFWSILTGTSSDPIINAATKLETKGWLSSFSFSGTYAVDHLNQEMVGSINKYFKEFDSKKAFNKKIETLVTSKVQSKEIQSAEKEGMIETLKNLYQKITPPPPHWLFGSFFQKKQSTYMVKFQDLAALAKLDSRFKELTVTGFSLTNHKEEHFNAETAPEVEIAEAVRGSMALPVVFDPVIINGEKIEDGGVGSNTPAEVFKGFPRAKILVLQFENNGRFNQMVYGPSKDQKSAGFAAREEEAVKEKIAGNPDLAKDAQRDREKLYEAGLNAMMVAEGDLGTMSFTASQERLRQAQRQAKIRATEAFSLLQDQAVDHIFNSLEEAMKGMSSRELENIVVHYVSKSDGKDLLPEVDRQAISKAAQDELATRSQTELPLSV